MLTVLAETTPDPNALASWLSVLFYLGGFMATVLGAAVAVKSLRSSDNKEVAIGNQPLEVRAAASFATKEDHRKLEERFEAEQLSQAGKRRGIYTKIEELGKDVAKLQVETTSQTRQLHSLDTKIENMPEKIVKLLKT